MKKENGNNRNANGRSKGGQPAAGDAQNTQGNMIKDPDNWTTGDEPMTGAQQSYLKTLSEEAGEPLNEQLTKAEASKKIDELQQQTGRGLNSNEKA